MQEAGPSAPHIFRRNKPWLNNKILQRTEKFTVKMGKIVKEVRYEMPEAFLDFMIFLPAMMAIPVYYLSPTIKTVLFFSLGEMGQIVKFSLK